ncbi:MAG TPA: hypothetical protein VMZ28_25205 [Kofleriaceae bacterium]|nr:hypothetical protein [Kofleriaceae bacterium]
MKGLILLALAAAVAGPLACRDDEAARKKAAAPVGALFDAAPPPIDARPPVVVEELPAGVTEAAALDDARALPAWSAVLERGRLLARRGERGAVFGRVGPTAGGVTWLVDESDTARGLGIRVTTTSGGEFPAKAGERVLAHGAWTTTADRRWVFAAERLVRLASAEGPAPTGESFLPGELIRAGEPREGDRELVVVSAPSKPGDGWGIADKKGAPATEVLLLPGEAAIYGGLDFLAPDERWQLEVGKRYAAPVVPIKTVRKPPLPLLRATAAPVALQ